MRPDYSKLAVFTSALIKQVKLWTEERALKSKAARARAKVDGRESCDVGLKSDLFRGIRRLSEQFLY